nr:CBS domain-containing protein CBSX3, mitochondrial-like [Tanacetum cinerariifolium]
MGLEGDFEELCEDTRRSSLFDMTTDSVGAIPIEEHVSEDNTSKVSSHQISPLSGFPMATFPPTVAPVSSPLLVRKKKMKSGCLIIDNRIKHIPVIYRKGMLRMVSIGDVVRAVSSEHMEGLEKQ